MEIIEPAGSDTGSYPDMAFAILAERNGIVVAKAVGRAGIVSIMGKSV